MASKLNKIYAITSIGFVILLLFKVFVLGTINNEIITKVVDYSFWYVFGLFSAFFIIRRIMNIEDEQKMKR